MLQRHPSRGEIWFVDLNPVRGQEQAGKRPALVVSVDLFNSGPAGLVVVLPITTKDKGIPFHMEIHPPDLAEKSFIKCEDIRSISKDRLLSIAGKVTSLTMAAVEDRIHILLNF